MPLDQRHPFPLRLASCWNSRLAGRLASECLAAVYLAAVCLAAGCSPVPPSVVPVSGRVTLAGEPLAGAVVTFQPAPGESAAELSGSVGRTNAEGRYELRLVDP